MGQSSKNESKQEYYTLRFRSTGLGKTMLEGEPADVLVVDDMLVMHIQTTAPVRWVIRAAITYKGLLKILILSLKPPVIKFLLFGCRSMRKPKLAEDF
jgi:hypothetical protein